MGGGPWRVGGQVSGTYSGTSAAGPRLAGVTWVGCGGRWVPGRCGQPQVDRSSTNGWRTRGGKLPNSGGPSRRSQRMRPPRIRGPMLALAWVWRRACCAGTTPTLRPAIPPTRLPAAPPPARQSGSPPLVSAPSMRPRRGAALRAAKPGSHTCTESATGRRVDPWRLRGCRRRLRNPHDGRRDLSGDR